MAKFAALTLTIGSQTAHGQVVINEMITKSSGGGEDPQFVELFNTTGSPIDLTGWTIDVYDSADETTVPPFGDSLFAITFESGTIPADGYFLLGTPEFQVVYSITPDVSIPDGSLPGDDAFTMILRDSSSATVYSTFVIDGGENVAPNDAGTPVTPEITVGPDGNFTPAGYTLNPEGGTSASVYGFFDPEPNPSATPMATTPNVEPPRANTFIPDQNAFLAGAPENLVLGFNVEIAIGTGFITIVDASDGLPVQTFDVTSDIESDATGVRFTPTPPLAPGSYYVLVDDTAIDDVVGNSFAGISDETTWAFTIAAPAVLDGSGPYTEDFSGFTSTETGMELPQIFPVGWTVSGDDLTYDGDWGTGFSGGFRGNNNVLGYQHTGGTEVLDETLTILNDTGSTIENLTVSYRGRVERAGEGRSPEFTVEVAGNVVPALAYSTTEPDNTLKTASVNGLFIENGQSFTIVWSSSGEVPGSGSRKQIGISEVSVAVGATEFPPTVGPVTVNLLSLTVEGVDVDSAVLAEGGDVVTEMGFVYSETALDPTPEIGEPNVTVIMDPFPGVAPFFGELSGLTAGTEYTVRSYATNSVGTAYSAEADFTTLSPPASFTGTYMEPFDAFDGSFPDGWTGLSSGGVNGYGGDWGAGGSSAGFRGGASSPGVVGYQHTSTSGTLELTLRLINDTGAPITDLNFRYRGQVERITQTRAPEWTATLDGVEVPELAYSTSGGMDELVEASLSGLNIGDGDEFTLVWSSDRGLPIEGETGGSSRQIGLGEVVVSTDPIPDDPYDSWATANGLTGDNNGAEDDAENGGIGDGIANVLEFILGGDPLAVDPSILPFPSVDADDFIFTFERSDDSEAGATATFQWTTDLDFSAATEVIIGAESDPANGVEVIENDGAPDTIIVRVSRDNAVDGKIQARLQGTRL